MKKHTQVLLLLLMGLMCSANAQRIARTTTKSGNVYPLISANNLAAMFTMTQADWERGMSLITKVRDDFGDLGISYTCENKTGTEDGFCFVSKNRTPLKSFTISAQIKFHFSPK